MDGQYPEESLTPHFPLSALVEGQQAIDAISCGLCSKDIHSILIVGPPGTGKSVAARAAAGISGGKHAVELPPNATREQIFGAVDLESALTSGKKVISDSIMKRADGNILIADNINLLAAGTLHTLLNYVQEGEVMSEMEGTSLRERCDTLLIGTMDPSDGQLDEHMLDRFDICIYMTGLERESDRMEVIRRRLSYEKDPAGFISGYEQAEKQLTYRIRSADPGSVKITTDYPKFITDICASMNVVGHRGDIAVLNTACALAALDGRLTAGMQDLKKAVDMCLQHRRHDDVPQPPPPPPTPQEPEEPEDPPEEQEPPQEQQDNEQPPPHSEQEQQNSSEENEESPSEQEKEGEEKIFGIGEEFRVADYIPPEKRTSRNTRSGRQDSSVSKDGTGRTIGYMIPFGKPRDISLTASIFVAAPKQKYRERKGMAIAITSDDLREKVRIRNKGTEVLFVVDGSGSMGAYSRMVAVKGAILSMLDDAYKKRDQVGLVVFRGKGAEEILPMTRSVYTAYQTLKEIPTGGKTPLNAGLRKGYEILKKAADSDTEPVMVIMTDGRGNVASDGRTADAELKKITKVLSDSGIRIIVVDTETGLLTFGRARSLAMAMEATYLKLEDLNAEHLSSSIKTALAILTE